jgi:LmbE family N-acetylglucosaminyl deacetylase
LAAAEAVLFSGLTKIASSDPAVDEAYPGHDIQGVAFYYTREPNMIVDISKTWDEKIAAVRSYQAQFTADDMTMLVMALDMKSRQVAGERNFEHGEPLKVIDPRALHCGI